MSLEVSFARVLDNEIYQVVDTDCWLRIVGCRLMILKDLLAYLYCHVKENGS